MINVVSQVKVSPAIPANRKTYNFSNAITLDKIHSLVIKDSVGLEVPAEFIGRSATVVAYVSPTVDIKANYAITIQFVYNNIATDMFNGVIDSVEKVKFGGDFMVTIECVGCLQTLTLEKNNLPDSYYDKAVISYRDMITDILPNTQLPLGIVTGNTQTVGGEQSTISGILGKCYPWYSFQQYFSIPKTPTEQLQAIVKSSVQPSLFTEKGNGYLRILTPLDIFNNAPAAAINLETLNTVQPQKVNIINNDYTHTRQLKLSYTGSYTQYYQSSLSISLTKGWNRKIASGMGIPNSVDYLRFPYLTNAQVTLFHGMDNYVYIYSRSSLITGGYALRGYNNIVKGGNSLTDNYAGFRNTSGLGVLPDTQLIQSVPAHKGSWNGYLSRVYNTGVDRVVFSVTVNYNATAYSTAKDIAVGYQVKINNGTDRYCIKDIQWIKHNNGKLEAVITADKDYTLDQKP